MGANPGILPHYGGHKMAILNKIVLAYHRALRTPHQWIKNWWPKHSVEAKEGSQTTLAMMAARALTGVRRLGTQATCNKNL
eukprot:1125537-Amphidinium_carterae.1